MRLLATLLIPLMQSLAGDRARVVGDAWLNGATARVSTQCPGHVKVLVRTPRNAAQATLSRATLETWITSTSSLLRARPALDQTGYSSMESSPGVLMLRRAMTRTDEFLFLGVNSEEGERLLEIPVGARELDRLIGLLRRATEGGQC